MNKSKTLKYSIFVSMFAALAIANTNQQADTTPSPVNEMSAYEKTEKDKPKIQRDVAIHFARQAVTNVLSEAALNPVLTEETNGTYVVTILDKTKPEKWLRKVVLDSKTGAVKLVIVPR